MQRSYFSQSGLHRIRLAQRIWCDSLVFLFRAAQNDFRTSLASAATPPSLPRGMPRTPITNAAATRRKACASMIEGKGDQAAEQQRDADCSDQQKTSRSAIKAIHEKPLGPSR